MSLFQFGFERTKCPRASAETSVPREHPVKEEVEEKEEFEEEGSKENVEKAPAAKSRKLPMSQYNDLHIHEDNLPLWLR